MKKEFLLVSVLAVFGGTFAFSQEDPRPSLKEREISEVQRLEKLEKASTYLHLASLVMLIRWWCVPGRHFRNGAILVSNIGNIYLNLRLLKRKQGRSIFKIAPSIISTIGMLYVYSNGGAKQYFNRDDSEDMEQFNYLPYGTSIYEINLFHALKGMIYIVPDFFKLLKN